MFNKTTTTNFDADYFQEFDNNITSRVNFSTIIERPDQHWNYGKNLSYTNDDKYNEKLELKKNQWKLLREQNPPSATADLHIRTDGFFCEAPSKYCIYLYRI